MQSLKQDFSRLFCCFGHKPKDQKSSSTHLVKLDRPVSALSVVLSYTTIPRMSSDTYSNDMQTFHHIFSSSSSIRGYQTAATTPGVRPDHNSSFDLDFRFGSESPSKRPASRIEQFGNHVRQKLSESRLSHAPSYKGSKLGELENDEVAPLDTAKHDLAVVKLGVSHQSTGLTELLDSRHASLGGYDSDARSIPTPILQSNCGTLRLTSRSNQQLQCPTVDRFDEIIGMPPGLHDVSRVAQTCSDDTVKDQASPSPVKTVSTTKTMTTAFRHGSDQSTKNLIRHIAVAPDHNGGEEMARPQSLRDWTCNSEQSNDVLSLQNEHFKVYRIDNELTADIDVSSDEYADLRKSGREERGDDDKRESLISNLDPMLLDYMSHFDKRESVDARSTRLPTERVSSSTSRERNRLTVENLHNTTTGNGIYKSAEFQSLSDTEDSSVHLFDMRISQRLASTSLAPFSSPSNSNNASHQSLARGYRKFEKNYPQVPLPRYPTWITAEPNRLPSDPKTRYLFENEVGNAYIKDTTSSFSKALVQRRSLSDGASSFYATEGGAPESTAASMQNMSHHSSIKNPHSLAVGGRSVSVILASRKASSSTVSDSSVNEVSQHLSSPPDICSSLLGLDSLNKRGFRVARNVNVPHHEYVDAAGSPTPRAKRYNQNDETNETMSEVSIAAREDRRNEQFSEVNPPAIRSSLDSSATKPGKWVVTPLSAVVGNVEKADGFQKGDPRMIAPSSGSKRATATSMWNRAFNHAGVQSGNVDTQLKSLTRKRARTLSQLEARTALERAVRSETKQETARSRSADGLRLSSSTVDMDQHHELCTAARLPLSQKHQVIRTIDLGLQPDEKQHIKDNPKKKSFLDLRDKVIVADQSRAASRQSVNKTPIKGLINVWTRFPSHTREERNGPAKENDGVKIRDFFDRHGTDKSDTAPIISSIAIDTKLDFTHRNTPNWKNFSSSMNRRLGKLKSKSMTLRTKTSLPLSLADRARKDRKGFGGKLRSIYRNSSYDLTHYTTTHGHRSSVSVGDVAEFPELECLPGEGMFKTTTYQQGIFNKDGNHDEFFARTTSWETQTSENQGTKPAIVDARDMAKLYEDCVGDLSALRSTTDVADDNVDDDFVGTATSKTARTGTKNTKIGQQSQVLNNVNVYEDTMLDDSNSENREKTDSILRMKMPGGFD